jgi:peptidoglycan/LPS O-acetylase OafA/YrhL
MPIKRFQTLEGLRGAAALLVVMYHLQDVFSYRAEIVPFLGAFGAGNRGVDLFFVLSGFIMMWSHRSEIGLRGRTLSYLYKRGCRIFPAVWILTAIAAATYGLGFGGLQKASKLDLSGVVASAFLLPQRGPALINVTWTLTYEILFYSLFALLIVNRRVGVLAILAWQLGVALASIGLFDPGGWLVGYYLNPICLEFGIGMVCAMIVIRMSTDSGMPTRPVKCLLAIGASLFVGGLLYEGLWDQQGLTSVRVLVYGVGAGAMIVALALLESGGQVQAPVPLVLLGDSSYSVYLIHYSVITLTVTLLVRLRLATSNPVLLFSCAILAIAAGAVFHAFVDTPIQTHLRRLGRRWFESRGSSAFYASAPVAGIGSTQVRGQ